MTFKEKLIRLRKIKSLTQDDFAKAVGVSRQAVYKWESGQSYPEVPKLREIKLLFGISIDDLLDDTYDVELPEKKRKKRMSKAEKERIEALIRAEEGFDDEDADDEFADDDADTAADADSDSVDDGTEEPKTDISADELFGSSASDTVANEPAAAPAADTATADIADDSAADKKGFFGRIFGKK